LKLGELVHSLDYPALVAETADGRLLGMLTYVPTFGCGMSLPIGSSAPPFPRYTQIDAVAFSPNDRILAGADTGDGIVRLWNITSGRQIEILVFKGTDATSTLAFSPNGQILAVVYGGDKVRLWDSATGQQIRFPRSLSYRATTVAFSPGGQMLAVADQSGAVQLWDIASRNRSP
jgi:WD40 repeat protein